MKDNNQNQTLLEKVKELEAKNNSLTKTIEGLKDKQEINQGEKKLFACSACKKTLAYNFIRLVDKNNQKTCRNCLVEMLNRANQLTGEEIVLRKKKKEETEIFSCATCQETYQGKPHQVHITNFQEQGIIPQQLVSICSHCLKDKVVLADFYCPLTSEGKDTWNPREAQFDCYCSPAPK